jgi:hypothetical protein
MPTIATTSTADSVFWLVSIISIVVIYITAVFEEGCDVTRKLCLKHVQSLNGHRTRRTQAVGTRHDLSRDDNEGTKSYTQKQKKKHRDSPPSQGTKEQVEEAK